MTDTPAIPNDFVPDGTTLSGQTVLVTGAASQIGAAVAFAAAQSGATVLLLDRHQRDIAVTYDRICALEKQIPTIIEFDTISCSVDDFHTLGSMLAGEFPELHGLVHCAIWGAPLTPIANADMTVWQKVIDQQLIRPMYLVKALYPLINHNNPSTIIFTTLDVGRKGRAYWGALGAAFAGLENFGETLAAECENFQTAVATLDCGKVKTALRKQFYPAETGEDLRNPDDSKIINSFLYLFSDQSANSGYARFTVPSA